MISSVAQRFALGLLVWCLASALVLSLFGRVTILLIYAVVYVGFLLAAEYSAPASDPPRWHTRLRWVTILGFIGFIGLVINWTLRLLGMQPSLLGGVL